MGTSVPPSTSPHVLRPCMTNHQSPGVDATPTETLLCALRAQDPSKPCVKNHHSLVLRAESASDKYMWLARLKNASDGSAPSKSPLRGYTSEQLRADSVTSSAAPTPRAAAAAHEGRPPRQGGVRACAPVLRSRAPLPRTCAALLRACAFPCPLSCACSPSVARLCLSGVSLAGCLVVWAA
jgi:hypothetical protein